MPSAVLGSRSGVPCELHPRIVCTICEICSERRTNLQTWHICFCLRSGCFGQVSTVSCAEGKAFICARAVRAVDVYTIAVQ